MNFVICSEIACTDNVLRIVVADNVRIKAFLCLDRSSFCDAQNYFAIGAQFRRRIERTDGLGAVYYLKMMKSEKILPPILNLRANSGNAVVEVIKIAWIFDSRVDNLFVYSFSNERTYIVGKETFFLLLI